MVPLSCKIVPSDDGRRRLAWLIAAQAVMTLLAGVNLLAVRTTTAVAAGEFVRWRELFSMSLITPGSVALLFLVIWALERGRADATGPLTLFVVSACLLGISMGCHEPINFLRGAADHRLERSLYFWDETYSHPVFFGAYCGISLALVWSQVRNPLRTPLSKTAATLFAGCGVVAGTGITFTLIHGGDITVDLTIIGVVIVLAECLRRRQPFALLPVNITLEGAYLLALVALLLAKR